MNVLSQKLLTDIKHPLPPQTHQLIPWLIIAVPSVPEVCPLRPLADRCLKTIAKHNLFHTSFSKFTNVSCCFMSVQHVQGMDVEGCESSQRRRMATGTLSCELATASATCATGPLNRTLMPPCATSWRNSKRPRSVVALRTRR